LVPISYSYFGTYSYLAAQLRDRIKELRAQQIYKG
jgi:hypothetical protein